MTRTGSPPGMLQDDKRETPQSRKLRELGHASVMDALRELDRLQGTVRIMHTWAKVPGSLVPKHVEQLTGRALRLPAYRD